MGLVDGPGLVSLGLEPVTWTILAYSPSPFTLSSLLHYKTTLTDNILRPTTFLFDFLRLTGTFQRIYGEWNFSTPILVNAAGSTFSHPAALDDFSKMPNLEDTGIFDDAYDDRNEGAEADYNNLETVIPVSPIPPTRIHKDHPKEQIIKEVSSVVQTRKMAKQNEAGLITFINKQRRTNHKDFQNCLFVYFLSQMEPKKVTQALDDESWVETMQEELL
nr:hypothetical protein [Tanacetum cinerariifolium]